MSKRKRGEDVDADHASGPNNFRKQRQITATFEDSSKQLAKAFKTARGFERQKLGRRKKNAAAGKDEKEMARIDAEVAALKTLDMSKCAAHHLSKSMLRIKAIATHPDLPDELQKPIALSRDPAALNVNARLCNSNPVKEAFPVLFGSLKREFGVDDGEGGPSKKRRLRAKDYDAPNKARRESASSVDGSVSVSRRAEAHATRQNEMDTDGATDSDEESQDLLDQLEGRLASTSDEDNDSEPGSDIEDLERQLEQEGISRKLPPTNSESYNHEADLSLSESESEAESSPPEPVKAKAPAPKKSSFIPSLSLGGYISGSGSDLDDEDMAAAPRKNRRGQRARQQIWEQKYGSRAKHLQQQQRQDRKAGWDPKRGAVEGKQKPHRFANAANAVELGPRRQKAGQRKGAGGGEGKKVPKKDDSGPLHPSWEAAKRAKEKKSAPVSFQGKKISFD